MRRIVFAAVLFAFAALVTPAFAQSEEDVLAQIEALHGKSDAFGEAFGLLQDAFLFGDPQTLADLAVYPLTVQANGEVYDIASAQDLIDNAQSLITPETAEALSSQDFADLIVTSDGVGFANGALWMSLVCVDDSCSDSYWGIIAINN
ncbi:MAG: hypothetical protein KKF33_16205 [Alphaproteobacteria bacterium]|nr:hypothetical protein [Alphaproteobacteria bacterium]